jgi:hypothetical protein
MVRVRVRVKARVMVRFEGSGLRGRVRVMSPGVDGDQRGVELELHRERLDAVVVRLSGVEVHEDRLQPR